MRKFLVIALILIYILALSACLEPAEKTIATSANDQIVECVKPIPLYFYAPDELEASTSAEIQASMKASILQIKNEAHPQNDVYALDKLDYYYIPVYAEQRYKLSTLSFNGGVNGTINLWYYLEDYSELTDREFLRFQMSRDNKYGAAWLEDSITRFDLQPFEDCEGVYYYDAYNGEHYSTYFYWVHDGYEFVMQVWSAIMDDIKENDPEALNGALFELEKVELE